MPAADYLVVGAGSAGAALAARLSERAGAEVLLLEAGRDYRSADTPPEFRVRNLPNERSKNNPDFYWAGLTAVRNPHQERGPYLRGRGLGGTSTVNGLCALRGEPDDFARWVQFGATGWSYDEILPAYNRLERDIQYGDQPYHGDAGPVPIYREAESGWGMVDEALRAAAFDAGHEWCSDHNAPNGTGVSPFAMNIVDGRRVSTNDAYLDPIRDTRPNLRVVGDASVDRVLFSGAAATGVRLIDGREFHVRDGGTVVLSAGAVGSPAILMRSGIGPAEQLRGLGIDVRQDLPVGEYLHDHAIMNCDLPVAPERTRKALDDRPFNCIVRYTSGMGESGQNDMLLIASNQNYWFNRPEAGVAIALHQCFSRGRLTLTSADPTVLPDLDLALLEEEVDFERVVDATERVRELFAHSAFQEFAAGPPDIPTRENLRREIRDSMHICATAPMGAPDGEMTVVDPQCRVLGVDGLRVVDASVMPEAPRANPNLTIMMLAEHLAPTL